jgi:hypothetical protein
MRRFPKIPTQPNRAAALPATLAFAAPVNSGTSGVSVSVPVGGTAEELVRVDVALLVVVGITGVEVLAVEVAVGVGSRVIPNSSAQVSGSSP